MRFKKSQPAGAATIVPPSASTGLLKNMDASTPAREHLRTVMARAGRYEERALHKAGVGANRPRVQR
jgi:hypothetical protein